MDKTTSQGMFPITAAKLSLEAIALEERERVIASPLHQGALYLKLIWPTLLDWLLRKRAKTN